MNTPDLTKSDHVATWADPVSVSDKNTSLTTISDSQEAYRFLMNRWPGIKGPAFARARRASMAALSGKGSGEEARSCFIAACLASDCLIRAEP
ncbi:DUF982 domain-containing protein [Rhizobium halophilum]|uniref:DUF982 domain-containing protein n=1 Tax=Rhizobium halophilum TaxID=2846852 RepID=UPI001EFE1637|nr:DUF982 domain-containing protein [Rhizobium halophilum]MCF6369620.1 DUF982 domain-containing protein [Rhizobium halophilum]